MYALLPGFSRYPKVEQIIEIQLALYLTQLAVKFNFIFAPYHDIVQDQAAARQALFIVLSSLKGSITQQLNTIFLIRTPGSSQTITSLLRTFQFHGILRACLSLSKAVQHVFLRQLNPLILRLTILRVNFLIRSRLQLYTLKWR